MHTAIKTIILLGVILLASNGLWGCSGATGSPVAPITAPDALSTTAINDSQRMLWGIWDIYFDVTEYAVVIGPNRSLQPHFDITHMVTPPVCDDCLEINVNSFDPDTRILDADVTLRNPVQLPGFDVRGILYTNDYGHMLTNADSWTGLWDVPGGEVVNPFKNFYTYSLHRRFAIGSEVTVNYMVYIPVPPVFNQIQFAVDASWPGNCKEPYEIMGFSQDVIFDEVGSIGNIYVGVYDWQNDVNEVTLEAPEITGEPSTPLKQSLEPVWDLDLTNNTGAIAGYYSSRIVAKSTNSGTLPLYYFVEILIQKSSLDGWARTWGGVEDDCSRAVAVDDYGNIYITGYFEDTVDFDPGPGVVELTSSGGWAIFLSKFDSNGDLLWARTWDLFGLEIGNGVAVDGSGNVYIVGNCKGTWDWDNDAFLRKLNSNGSVLWTRTWGGIEGDDDAYGVALDDYGNAYVVGSFELTVDFDPGPGVDKHTSHWDTSDIFISKFNSNGVFQWASTWGGYEADKALGVALDDSGNIYVVGSFEGTVDFDPGPGVVEYTSNGYEDAFLCKLDSDSNFLWACTLGKGGNDSSRGVTVDDYGNVYIAGQYDYDAFLGKLDSSGGLLWDATWGGQFAVAANGVALDDYGNAYVTGHFDLTVDFDPGPGVDEHTTNAGWDIFLSKFDSSGGFQWARTWGGDGWWDKGLGVASDDYGNAYVVGGFKKTVDFNPSHEFDNHKSNGGWEAFLSKFPPDGNW